MGVKIEISADTAAEAVALGKELFGLVGVTVLGLPAETTVAPKATRTTKKADEPKPEPTAAQEPAVTVDPFAEQSAAPAAASPAASPSSQATATASASGSATTASPSDAAVSINTLKQKLTEVLKAKSAATAQKALMDATGGAHKSITGMPESFYPAALAQLEAALKG